MLANLLRVIMRRIKSSKGLRSFIHIMSKLHLFVYRLSGGLLTSRMTLRGGGMLLLTTIGSKSGKERTVPLLYIKDANDIAIIASYGGLDQYPGWWWNLKANPEAQVQIREKTIKVRAEQADAATRSRLWPVFNKVFAGYKEYQSRTDREIPIVLLHPLQSAS